MDAIKVTEDLHQRDTLQKVKTFLRDLAHRGETNMDPQRLYEGVCKSLGEEPIIPQEQGA